METLTDTNVDALVELASTTPAGRLGAAIAAWSRRHEGADDIDRRHRRERSVGWRTDPDGMVTIAAVTSGGAVEAEVVVHVRGDDPAVLADGTPISDHAVARLLDEAFISLLLHDTDRHPIDASPRRRSPTRRQRRVVDEAHVECDHPGCHARALLQYDHVQPYALGGTTTINNLRRLCGPHNRARSRAGP